MSKIEKSDELPKIGAPATRALNSIGVTKLTHVANHNESELLHLHGFGPKALRILKQELASRGLSFKNS
jgi:hypothetical protein